MKKQEIFLVLIFITVLISIIIYSSYSQPFKRVSSIEESLCPLQYGKSKSLYGRNLIPFFNPNHVDIEILNLEILTKFGRNVYEINKKIGLNETTYLILKEHHGVSEETKIRWCCSGECYETKFKENEAKYFEIKEIEDRIDISIPDCWIPSVSCVFNPVTKKWDINVTGTWSGGAYAKVKIYDQYNNEGHPSEEYNFSPLYHSKNVTTLGNKTAYIYTYDPSDSQICNNSLKFSCPTTINPPTVQPINYTGSINSSTMIIFKCNATDLDGNLDYVGLWVGNCSNITSYCNSANDYKNWYLENVSMTYGLGYYEYTWTITYPAGYVVGATCQAYDTHGLSSNWGDSYPLFKVAKMPKENYPVHPEPEDCKKLVTIAKSFCYADVAEIKNDIMLCEKVTNQEIKIFCIAKLELNEEKCKKIMDKDLREECIRAINQKREWLE